MFLDLSFFSPPFSDSGLFQEALKLEPVLKLWGVVYEIHF